MSAPARVLVFRLQLFKPSEPFIAAQAAALARHRPIYVGGRLCGPPPQGAEVVVVRGVLATLALVLAGRLPAAVEPGRTLVHAHFAVDALFALALARRLRAPLMVTLHGFDVWRSRLALLRSGRPALALYALIGWPLLRARVDLWLAVAPRVAAAALARGAPGGRLHVQPIGVDVEWLRPAGQGDPDLIVHVGRLVEKKGARVLLEAFARLAPRRPALKLVLVGEGPLRGELEAGAARLGLAPPRVRFAGALPHGETLAWLRRAAIVAQPSLTARDGDAEGLPIAVLDAAALGRAVVATEAAGAALAAGTESLRVPAGDAGALADALDRLLADAALRARLGAAARRRVESDYSHARRTAELERLYDAALEAGPRGR